MCCIYIAIFILDFLPETDNRVLLLSACSGHGFKFCSVVGEIAAEMVRILMMFVFLSLFFCPAALQMLIVACISD